MPINKVADPRKRYAAWKELVNVTIRPKAGGPTTTPKNVTNKPPPVARDTSLSCTVRVISAR